MAANSVSVENSVDGGSGEIVLASKRDAAEKVLRLDHKPKGVEEKTEKCNHDM